MRRDVLGCSHATVPRGRMGVGNIVLFVEEEAEEGGYVVTSPLEPSLVTEAETIAEAFDNARDALNELARARAKPPRPRKARPA